MPLRDHFRPPFSERHSWAGFHGQWPAVIVQQLVRQLPLEYTAEPRVHLGAEFEIDIGTFESDFEGWGGGGTPDVGGGGTALWSPAEPTLSTDVELPDTDEYEVRVYDQSRERQLVAAIELISPSNKDRPEHRGQFLAKCAALLRQEVSVVLVDVVTVRAANLYSELLKLLDERDPTCGDSPSATYAAACRHGDRGGRPRLDAWYHPFAGDALPTLPLWLTPDLAVPLDLEASYTQTCRDLRIA